MAEQINQLGAILGLLQQGFTPEQARAQVDEARAMQFAQLSPSQQRTMMGFQAGQGLGRGISSLFGVQQEDPTVRMATQLRELQTQFDTSTSAGMMDYAKALKDINPGLAQQAQKAALELRVKEADISKKTAETAKLMSEGLTTEQRNAAARADAEGNEKGFTRGSAEWAVAYNKALTSLTTKDGSISDLGKLITERARLDPVKDADKIKAYDAKIRKLTSDDPQETFEFVSIANRFGFGVKNLSQYTPEQTKKILDEIERLKIAERKAGATNVSIDTKAQGAFATALGELDAKEVAKARETRANAVTTIRSLDELSRLSDQGLISGTFATGRTGFTNFLDTVGLLSEKDKKQLASSQEYQKVAGDVVLGTLGGKLGAGFSNEDRKFIQGLIPQLETSPLARRQLLDFMRQKFSDIVDETVRLEEYARDPKNRGLTGYKPKLPLPSASRVSNLTDEELARRAGGKIVNGVFVPNAK